MDSHILILFQKYAIALLVCLSYSAVTGEIIVSPKDTESSVGETIELVCTSTAFTIEWHHLRAGTALPNLVYKDGFIFNGYKERFGVNNCSSTGGECRLFIQNVHLNDAGTYSCAENSEESVQKSAQLMVFEQYPSTQFCVTRITCSPDCDTMELTCKMKYSGNMEASMEWHDSAGELVPSMEITVNALMTSTVQLSRIKSKYAPYTCRVNYSTSGLGSRYSWTHVPQELLASSTEKHGENQQMTIIAICVFAIVVIFGLIGYIWHEKRKRELRNNSSNVETGNDQMQSSGVVQQLSEQQTPLMNDDLELDESWTDGVIAPRTKVNKNQSINGLSVIDDEVFIVTREGCKIEVFDLNHFRFMRAWSIDGLVNPNDMVSCPKRKRLYICDWKKAAEDKEIICVDKDGIVEARWISENDKGRLSITNECHVIVAESWYNTIKEYSPQGQLIRRIQTGKDKVHLWHAIKLPNGNFVASFGDSQDVFQDVCILDNQGQTISSFTNAPASINQSIAVPRTLAVDDDGNIYVSDLYHGRVIMLTPELQWKGAIYVAKTGDKLRGPLRICLHEVNDKRQLLVADNVKVNGKWKDGRILMLDIEI